MENRIRQKEDNGKGMFFIEVNDKIVAELIYTRNDDGIVSLDHTEVDPEMEGKGLGSKLVRHSVEYARENNLKLDPLCGYVQKQFDKHPEYEDVKA